VQLSRERVEAARVELTSAQRLLDLVTSVDDPRAVARQEIIDRRAQRDAARARLEVARAEVAQGQAQLASAQTGAGLLAIRAPRSATVLQVNTREGQYATAGPGSGNQDPLMVLGETVPLHVRVDIDESEIGRARIGAPAVVSPRGQSTRRIQARYVRTEPLVVPKRSLTNSGNERVDVRVLQLIYALPDDAKNFFVGQQWMPLSRPSSRCGSQPRPLRRRAPSETSPRQRYCRRVPDPGGLHDLAAGARRPCRTVPPAYFSAPTGGLPAADWWQRRLTDPALKRLVDAALANAPDLAVALARWSRRGRDCGPRGGACAGARRIVQRHVQPHGDRAVRLRHGRGARHRPGTAHRSRAGALPARPRRELRSRPVRPAARRRTRRRARLDAAGFEAASVRLTLVTDVAAQLRCGACATARERIADENVRSARDTVSVTRSRVRAGLVSGVDQARAEGLLAETVATLPSIQAERASRIAALATLTGLAPAEIAGLVAAGPNPPRFGLPTAGLPSDLLLRRPDVAAALAQVAAADAETASAIAARYPRLTITASLGLVASALERLFTGDALSIVAGPGLAGPLLDFGRNRARVEQSRARTQEAVAQYRGAVLRAFGEVETNLATADARERQRIAVERLVAANADTARLARTRYRAGLTDFLPVLDAERTLLRSRDQLAAVEAEAADAELALFRAIGGDFR
jgi:outer membrane protein TolC